MRKTRRILAAVLAAVLFWSNVEPLCIYALETAQTDAETNVETTTEFVPETTMAAVPETTEETAAETTTEVVPETTVETVPETTEETVPETTVETVPETTEETVPETTAETVPEEERAERIAELETAIAGLPTAAELQAALEEEAWSEGQYLALKAQFDEVEAMLTSLAELTEAGTEALTLLSEEAQVHYQEIKGFLALFAEMATLEEPTEEERRLAEIETRILALPKASGANPRLNKADYIKLRDALQQIDEDLAALRAEYPDMKDLSAEAQAAYAAAVNTRELGPAAPDLTLLPGLDTTLNTDENPVDPLKFIWNNKGRVERPTEMKLGLGEPGEAADVNARVMVSVDGGESISLYAFYEKILTEHGGYGTDDIQAFVKSLRPEEKSRDVSQGTQIDLTWAAEKLLTSYTDSEGDTHSVRYQLAPAVDKLAGTVSYLVEQKNTGDQQNPNIDDTTVLATPTTEFNYSVVWYDNHDAYVDNSNPPQKARPALDGNYSPDYVEGTQSGPEYNGHLELIRIKDGNSKLGDLLEGKDFHPEITLLERQPNPQADQWNVHLSGLPMFGPNGEEYEYWARQTTRANGNRLNTNLSTGAYYVQDIQNNDLLDPEYPNAINNNGTVINTLSRMGEIKITKEWEDQAVPAEDRPVTTFHFYRIVETDVVDKGDDGTVKFSGFDGSPLEGHDDVTINPKDGSVPEGVKTEGNVVTITVPTDQSLPMFDGFGRRYIYYCLESMDAPGDYERIIHNENAAPVVLPDDELAVVREEATKAGIILNGARVTNKLKQWKKIPVEVDFQAQAIQNQMDGTEVTLQLQRRDPVSGEWVNYLGVDRDNNPYDGELVLADFHPETMRAEGESREVPKYDDEGRLYEYRWVQKQIHICEGDSALLEAPPDPADPDDETVTVGKGVPVRNGTEDVGPGAEGENTTLFFDVESTNPGKAGTQVITNTLVGNTRVEAKKTWIYTVDGKTYSTDPKAGEILWDGTKEAIPNAPEDIGKWPADVKLLFQVVRDGKPLTDENGPVQIEMPEKTYEVFQDDLPRYDENGNEYSYSLVEVSADGEWVATWKHSTSVATREDGVKLLQKTTAFENRIGPGGFLVIEATKHWEDDTDLVTRRAVKVDVFRLDDGQQVGSAELNLENNFYEQILIPIAEGETDSVSNYVLKETELGGVAVEDEAENRVLKERALQFGTVVDDGGFFEDHRHDPNAFEPYLSGTLAKNGKDAEGKLKFQYNVYLSAEETADGQNASYHIYNQRTAEMTVKLTKEWVNDGQESSATFALERLEDGAWKPFATQKPITLSTKDGVTEANGRTTAVLEIENLPKYDAIGVLYEYRVAETSMGVDGMPEATIEKGKVMAEGKDRTYQYTCRMEQGDIHLKQTEWDGTGPSPHHSGDIFEWNATNIRENTQKITIRKIWRDGAGPQNTQDPVTRPDISFHLYRISHAQIRKLAQARGLEVPTENYHTWMQTGAGSALFQEELSLPTGYVSRVDENVFWNTSSDATESEDTTIIRGENRWYWNCVVANQVPLYDSNGSPYIYFAYEWMRGNAYGYEPSYDNNHGDENLIDATKGKTEETFGVLRARTSHFLMVVDGENANDYYPCIVINTRQQTANISGKKEWNINWTGLTPGAGIPYENLPDITLTLWRAKATMEPPGTGTIQLPAIPANGITYEFVPAKWNRAEEIDTMTIKGEDTDKKYSFPSPDHCTVEITDDGKLPRYDEYGYRYSYWITEEKIPGYDSDRIDVTAPDGSNKDSAFDGFRGNFDVTNTYTVEEPHVQIAVTKTWDWTKLSDADKEKLDVSVTFKLHGFVAEDAHGNKIGDQVFATQTVTVTNGEVNPQTVTFTESNTGPFNGKKLPYYSPGGEPYLWYVEESNTKGYTTTSEIKKDKNHPAGVVTAVKGFFARMLGRDASSDPVKEGLSDVIHPKLDADTNTAGAEVTFTNTYVGNLRKLNVEKVWEDNYFKDDTGKDSRTDPNSKVLTALRKQVEVKLYRQWDVGGGKWAWEPVTEADETDTSGAWAQMVDEKLTVKKDNGWKLASDLTNLYQYAPNGKPYQYFVVEQGTELSLWYTSKSTDRHPDVSGGAGSMGTADLAQRTGYSVGVTLSDDVGLAAVTKLTNKLLTKELKVTKDWKRQIGAQEAQPLTAAEARELQGMGVLPERICFVVQYKVGDGGDWYLMPKDGQAFATDQGKDPLDAITAMTGTQVRETYCCVSNTVEDLIVWAENPEHPNMHSTRSVTNLPAYYVDASGQQVEVFYRWVEVMEWSAESGKGLEVCSPERDKNDGDVHSSHTSLDETNTNTKPVVKKGSQTFTNTIPVKPLLLRKIWINDNANRDDTRPEKISITVKRKDDDTDPGFTVELSKDDIKDVGTGNIYESKPHYVLVSQIRDVDNTELEATEADVPGYKMPTDGKLTLQKEMVDGVETYVFVAENTLEDDQPERVTIDLAATKTWSEEIANPDDWKDIVRPVIKFRLEYRYEKLDGTMEDFKPADQAGTGVTENTKLVEADVDGNYQVRWEGVYKYHEEDHSAIAKPIEYRIVEIMGGIGTTGTEPYDKPDSVAFTEGTPSYTAEVENKLKTVQPSVKKLWNYSGTKNGTMSPAQIENLLNEGVLPRFIRFELYYRQGSGGWTKVPNFEPLVLCVEDDLLTDKYEPKAYEVTQKFPAFDKNGKQISYELRETGIAYGADKPAADAFTLVVQNNTVGSFAVAHNVQGAHTDVTNTLPLGKLTVEKTWEDMENRDGLRKQIKVQLKRDGAVYDTVTLTEENGWTHTWEDLPVYQSGSKTQSVYEVTETTDLTGYTKEKNGTVGSLTVQNPASANLVNKHDPETLSVSAQKVWDDQEDVYQLRPDKIKLVLESSLDGKTWTGVKRKSEKFSGPDEIVFQKVEKGIWNSDGTVTVTGTGNTWGKVTWVGLPAYSGGTLVQYRVVEPEVPQNYACAPSETVTFIDQTDPVTVTNSLETTQITVEKVWEDQNNRYSTRPNSVTFKLQSQTAGGNWEDVMDADGVRTLTMTGPDWKPVIFDHLLVHDKNGQILHYQAVEAEAVDGYAVPGPAAPQQGKAKVTNKLETVDLAVTKVWEDEDDRYGTRPEDLKLTVSYRDDNGMQIALKPQPEVTWTKQDNTWQAKLTGLPKYIPGTDKIAEYTVAETVPTGYRAAKAAETADEHGAVTLKNILNTVDRAGAKTWVDTGDQDGLRPETITVRLYADGVAVPGQVAVVGEKQSWRWEFRNLPKYRKDGTEVAYTVVEDPVTGYIPQVNGMDIVNTHVSRKISIQVQKSWKDWLNVDKVRPESVTIHLLADGADTGKRLILNEENQWKGSFDGLSEFHDGRRIVYTVSEDPVAHYEATIQGSAEEGFTVVNRHGPKVLGELPKTGDDSHIVEYMIAMALSAAALTGAALFWWKRRRKRS